MVVNPTVVVFDGAVGEGGEGQRGGLGRVGRGERGLAMPGCFEREEEGKGQDVHRVKRSDVVDVRLDSFLLSHTVSGVMLGSVTW